MLEKLTQDIVEKMNESKDCTDELVKIVVAELDKFKGKSFDHEMRVAINNLNDRLTAVEESAKEVYEPTKEEVIAFMEEHGFTWDETVVHLKGAHREAL